MRWTARLAVILAGMACLFAGPPARAQTELKVATFVLPPYVMLEKGRLEGFAIDLWDEVAQRLQIRSDFQVMPNVAAMLAQVHDDKADIGVSGIFITANRSRSVDFTVSVLNTGMMVMVRDPGAVPGRVTFRALLRLWLSTTTLGWLVAGLVLILVPAHIIWWLERRREGGHFTRSYLRGIGQALYWSASALVMQTQSGPRRPAARAVGVVWMFVGLVYVSLYTALLAANLTVEKMRGAIEGPDDLVGKRVATLRDTTSDQYLRSRDITPMAFDDTSAMFNALLSGKADAILFSAPTLQYFAVTAGAGKVKLVGRQVHKLDLAFALPIDSAWRRKIDNVLLVLRDDGTYERIYRKWFGPE
jgi:polar amino acid transport system substrate-binding protein